MFAFFVSSVYTVPQRLPWGQCIFSNESYGQFFSYYKKRQNSTFLAFAKILSIGLILSLSKNNYFYVLNKS